VIDCNGAVVSDVFGNVSVVTFTVDGYEQFSLNVLQPNTLSGVVVIAAINRTANVNFVRSLSSRPRVGDRYARKDASSWHGAGLYTATDDGFTAINIVDNDILVFVDAFAVYDIDANTIAIANNDNTDNINRRLENNINTAVTAVAYDNDDDNDDDDHHHPVDNESDGDARNEHGYY